MKDIFKEPQWKADKLNRGILNGRANNVSAIVDEEFQDENIENIFDNEIKTESQSPIIAAVEHCQKVAASRFLPKPLVRDKWYQKYSLENGFIRNEELFAKIPIGEEISAVQSFSNLL